MSRLVAEPQESWPEQAKVWNQVLKEGKSWLSLAAVSELDPRDSQGRWNSKDLAALLTQNPAWQVHLGESAPKGARLARRQEPRVLLIENSSSVSPWSKRLASWGWNVRTTTFEAIEKEPRRFMDAEVVDLMVIGSPGWWQDFANPPSGPSRMGEAVASTLSDYLRMGGSAIFIDIAQWDMEAIGFKGLRMGQLGPREVVEFEDPWGQASRIGLAAFGVMAQRPPQNSAPIFWHRNFENMDGDMDKAYAAFVSVPPHGLGFAVGLAFHPLEQDEEVVAKAQALVIQIWLLSGAKSIFWNAKAPSQAILAPKKPIPVLSPTFSQPSLTPTFRPSPVPPSPSVSPSPSYTPRVSMRRPNPILTVTPSSTPYRLPVIMPRPTPSLVSTRIAAHPVLETTSLMAKLSCLQSSPEPFSEGGVYLFFCIDQPAQVLYRIFDLKGHEVFTGPLGSYQPGRNQVFFSGLSEKGKYLTKGRYFYRLEAVYSGKVAEWRQAEFNFKPKIR